MQKIHHVFISSTFVDLADARKKISEAVAKAGYVPEGMEIFPASSQSQMDFIKRVIDRCDYYIVILGGRYGSEGKDGLSYTEMEFEYALDRSIPVLAFLPRDEAKLSAGNVEKDLGKQKKLEEFKRRLTEDAVVDYWDDEGHLAAIVLAALSQESVSRPGVGWIRANFAAQEDLLQEVHALRKANDDLTKSANSIQPQNNFDDIKLAGLDEEFCVRFEYKHDNYRARQSLMLSWREIIKIIGPEYRAASNTTGVQKSVEKYVTTELPEYSRSGVTISVEMRDKKAILLQMEVLGFMTASVLALKGGGNAVFHQLTAVGENVMLRENAIKNTVAVE